MAMNDNGQENLQGIKTPRGTVERHSERVDTPMINTADYVQYPIHECFMPRDLFSMGLGTLLLSRKMPGDELVLAGFMVDVFCLGVKNTLFTVMNQRDYAMQFKQPLIQCYGEQGLESIEPCCFVNLIEGAVDYAKGHGLGPHPGYAHVKAFFGDIDKCNCSDSFRFGKNGKPFFTPGPNETRLEIQQVIQQLKISCGVGGYDFSAGIKR